MDENNNLNVTSTPVTNETPVQPVAEPAPVVEPAPAVTPEVAPAPVAPAQDVVTPVAPAVNVAPQVAPAPEAPKGKKSNPIVVVILILAIIGIAVYAIYTYTDIFKGDKKTSGDTTTTTTTTAVVKELYFKSFEEYTTYMSGKAESKDSLFDVTGDLTELKFDLANQCTADGKEVTLTIGSYTVAYKCVLDQADNPIAEGPVYTAEVTVNDTAKINVSSFTECSDETYYTNGKYIISVKRSSCSVGFGNFNIIDMKGNKVIEDTNTASYYKKDSEDAGIRLALVNNANTLYFLTSASEDEGATTCSLKFIDLSKDTLSIETSTISEACYSTGTGV